MSSLLRNRFAMGTLDACPPDGRQAGRSAAAQFTRLAFPLSEIIKKFKARVSAASQALSIWTLPIRTASRAARD